MICKKNSNDVRFIFIYTCSQLFLTVKAFYVNLILYCHVYQKKSTDPVLLMVYLNNPATVCKVCFGFCFMSFILKFRHGSLMSSCYWFPCSWCHVLIGCPKSCVLSPLVGSCHVVLFVCYK